MDAEKIAQLKKCFTKEQEELYKVLLGDADKLRAEWMLCRRMYDAAKPLVTDRKIGPEMRVLLKSASTDYWNRRRLALERTLELVGMNDMLAGWRKEMSDAAG